MKHQRILVLGALDEKHHQKRDDGRAGVDNELSGFGILKYRAEHGPTQHDGYGSHKNARGAGEPGNFFGEAPEKRRVAALMRGNRHET